MADHHQRPTPCDVDGCENPAKYQCLNCEDAFCLRCKEKHGSKKPTHKFVLYSERLKRICKRHNANKYIYWCKPCSEACCVTCGITSHKGHDMVEIENAIRDKKESITIELGGPFQECLTQWENLVLEAKQTTIEYRANIQKIDQDLVSHANRIHEAIDKSLAKIRSELREISEKKETTLQTQEKSINDKYEEFKRNVEQLDELVEINDISLLENKLDIADMKALPVLTRPSLPSYTPGQIVDKTISTMMGNLNSSVQNNEKTTSSITESVTPHAESLLQASASVTPLLSTPVVVSSFNPGYDYPYIACTTSSGLAWVETGDTRIQVMDRHGAVRDTIHTEFGFFDITVTPQGDVLFTDYHNKCIASASKRARSWRIKTLFRTQDRPLGLCSLPNGDVVVTYDISNGHRVIQYNSKGGIIHKYDSSLFSDPSRVAVNKVNKDLLVCDWDKNKVLAFDKDKTLRYEYTGSDASSFDPHDVSTDTSGRVLLADMRNNRVHVLDMEGKFLQHIQPTGLREPRYIDVDSEGHAWIGEGNGQVKIVKYQNVSSMS